MGAKAKHDIAPHIRAWSAAGIRRLAERRQQTIPDLFADWFESNPAEMLRAVGRYTVREKQVSGTVQHDHRHTHEQVSDTAGWIEELIGSGAAAEAEELIPVRPVLFAPVRSEEAGH